MRLPWIVPAALAAALCAVPPASADVGHRLSGGLSAGPAIVQRDDGSTFAAIPRAFAGYSATDLLTAAAGLDLEISSTRPVYLGFIGGRLNLHRDASWRVAAGIEATHDFGAGDSGWRALFTGTRILARGSDGRPVWTVQYAPTLDFDGGKATHRLALTWLSIRSGGVK